MWEKYSDIIPHIAVDSGVIGSVADWVSANNYKSILVVCDPNTYRVAGARVIGDLKDKGLTVFECHYTENEPFSDEHSIGVLTAAYTPETDLILGIGSGTINDLCTYVGAKVNCPSAIVGTAPSMDGYASLGSAMSLDGVKVTPPTQCPVAIFCDTDILSEAPLHLCAAGLGDMLGKYTAHADWHLSHLLTGEPVPQDILQIVIDALSKIVEGAPHLAKRDPMVIKNVTEGLILSGIAMSLYGDSRPASGTEHHLAHFWEMRMLAEGITPALHGIKVGLATIVGLILWKELARKIESNEVNISEAINDKTNSKHEENIRRLYGHTAESILQVENPCIPGDLIKNNLQAILKIATALPSPEDIADMIKAVNAPVRPSDINLRIDTLYDSIVYARDRKKTFTILQLLGNLGYLEEFAKHVNKYFANSALNDVKCFVLDMDGTIYLGSRIFPYTIRFLEHLKSSGKDFLFYTNNSSQNALHYLKKLERMGISVEPGKFMMSTHVLLDYLNNDKPRVFVAGTKALKDDFEVAGYTLAETDPDFVVLGFDTDMDYERLTKLCDFIRAGLPYFGVHMDYNCPVEGGFIPDCGSLAAAVTAATGVTPEFFGKPSRHTLDYILKKTGYRENEVCFIGDRLYTDIAVTSNTSACSVLVLSGETKRNDLFNSPFIPDIIVEDLEELMRYI